MHRDDNRLFVEAVLYRYRAGIPWRDLPGPFTCYSHYKPSQHILSIRQKFGVRVIYVPLNRIPQQMLKQHQSFKFLNISGRNC